jgi:hypothetical protein
MSKFLLNILVQISKAFVYSKIQILFRNNCPQFSAQPRPILFFSNWPLPLFPLGLGLSAGPVGPRASGALPDCHLPHRKTPPAAPPSPFLRARLTGGPHLSSLTSSLPELGRAATTSRRSPRRPALPRMPPELLPPRYHFPLLNPPPNLAPPSMALTPLTPLLLPLATPLQRSPSPYKRAMRPPTLTIAHPPLPSSFAPSFALATSSSRYRSLSLVCRLSATPPSPVSTSLAPPRLAHPPPPSPVTTGELQHPRTANR